MWPQEEVADNDFRKQLFGLPMAMAVQLLLRTSAHFSLDPLGSIFVPLGSLLQLIRLFILLNGDSSPSFWAMGGALLRHFRGR